MSFGTLAARRLPALVRAAALAALAAAALTAPGMARAQGAGAPADKLVVLSTSDVKGKTVPCGCHVPKGGLSRRAGFADSLRALNPQLLVVDAGGFFPDGLNERDDAAFVARAMRDLRIDAAGVGDRELSYGRGFFLATVQGAQLPVVCANLLDKASGKPLVKPWLLLKQGKARVGVFGLISDKAPLGPSADSLAVTEPAAAARQAIADLRKQGATAIVLLSSLGKVETEDLALAVEGIDLAIAGRNVPLLQRARMVNQTTIIMGGEQSHYMGVSELTLDPRGRVTEVKGDTYILGPEITPQPAMQAHVDEFEARPEVKARRAPPVRPNRAAADTTATSAR